MNARQVKIHFSLIELIVVVTVFALLLVVLLPAYQRSRTNALENQCKYNLKKLGNAVQMYYSRNQFYPNAQEWIPQVRKDMVHFLSSFTCPVESDHSTLAEDTIPVHYGMNAALNNMRKHREIADIDQTVLITDALPNAIFVDLADNYKNVSFRHQDNGKPAGFNACFTDGSVRFVPAADKKDQ